MANIGTSTVAYATRQTTGQLVFIASDGSACVLWCDGTNQVIAYASNTYATWTKATHTTGLNMCLCGDFRAGTDNIDTVTGGTANVRGNYTLLTKSGATWTVGTSNALSGTTAIGVTAQGSPTVYGGQDAQGRHWIAVSGATNTLETTYYSAANSPTTTGWTAGGAVTQTADLFTPAADQVGNYFLKIYWNGTALQWHRVDNSGVSVGSWTTGATITNLTGSPNASSAVNFKAISTTKGLLTYSTGSGIYAQVYDVAGNSWGTATQLSTNANDRHPVIATDKAGNAWVVWCSYAAANSYALVFKKYNGSTWDAGATTLVASGTNIAYPNAGYGVNTLGVAYTQGTATTWTVGWITQYVGPVTRTIPTSAMFSGTGTLDLYGSNVADGTLVTACKMGRASGGTEVAATTTITGSSFYAEVWPKGNAGLISVASIPATPTGNGWIYQPGAGTIAAGNWSASIALAARFTGTLAGDMTLRFFTYSSGVYTSIGTIVLTSPAMSPTRAVYSFAATAMSAVTLADADFLYVDLWFHDTGGANSDNPVVYVSTSATQGVASDMQITTPVFTSAGGGGVRTIPTSAALLAEKTRTITTAAALLLEKTRTITTTAVLSVEKTRTVLSSASLFITPIRTIASSAAFLAEKTRTLASSAAFLLETSRTIGTSASLLLEKSRTITTSASLLLEKTRTIGSSAAFLLEKSRTIGSSAAFLLEQSRTIASSAALQEERTRTIASAAAFSLAGGGVRTIPTSAALLLERTRTITTTAALASGGIRTIPTSAALSTTWYVSGAVGTSGTGTTWGTAWKTFADIVWASVHPGDVIEIDGGVSSMTYNEVLTIGASGTATSPITIRASQQAGHNGTVIQDGGRTTPLPYASQSSGSWSETAVRFQMLRFGTYSYVTVDGSRWHGWQIKGAKYDGVDMSTSASHNTIRYLDIFDCGNATSGTDGWSTDRPGVRPAGDYLTVEYCDIHDNGQDGFQTGSSANYVSIKKTWLHNTREHPGYPGYSWNQNHPPLFNSGAGTHNDGYQNYTNPGSNLLFEDCLFGPGLMQGIILEASCTSNTIQQCLFYPNTDGTAIMIGPGGYTGTSWLIDAVTIFSVASLGQGSLWLEGTGNSVTNSIIDGGRVELNNALSSNAGNIQYNCSTSSFANSLTYLGGTVVNPNFVTDVSTFSAPPTFAQLHAADFTPQAVAAVGKGCTDFVSKDTFLLFIGATLSPTRTIPTSAALLAETSRTIGSSAALLVEKSRTVTSSAAFLLETSRTVTTSAALLAEKSCTIPSAAAFSALGTFTRTVPSSAALLQTNTRTVATSASLLLEQARTVTSSAAFLAEKNRTVATSAALSLLGTLTRTIPTNASFSLAVRTVPTTAAFSLTQTRTVSSSAALLATKTRTIATSSALLLEKARTIPTSVPLLVEKTRTVPSSAAFSLGNARVIPTSAALSGVQARTIPTAMALIATKTRTIPSLAAFSQARVIPTVAAFISTRTRTITTVAALTSGSYVLITTQAALQATQTRQVPSTVSVILIIPNALVSVPSGMAAVEIRSGTGQVHVPSGIAALSID